MDPVVMSKIDGETDLKFEDPKLSRPASIAAGTRNLEEARKRRQLGKGKEALVEDRDNPELEDIIAADPTDFMRKRLTKMMVRELAINDTLYSMTPPDHRAITESNKRLMDIGEALKALPNQTAGNGGSISLAEAIQAAIEARGSAATEKAHVASQLETAMLERSEEHFGEAE